MVFLCRAGTRFSPIWCEKKTSALLGIYNKTIIPMLQLSKNLGVHAGHNVQVRLGESESQKRVLATTQILANGFLMLERMM
jgi:hypothetical protein